MPLVRRPSVPSAGSAERDGAADAVMPAAGTADERRAAARAMAGRPDGVAALAAALAGERDPSVRETIFTSLARASTPESVEAVLPYLRADDAGLRTGALDALRTMAAATQPRLADLLADSDADIRLLSCEIVRALAPAVATPLLCGLLDRETEVNVCAAAVEVLAEVGTPEALPALTRCAQRFSGEPFLSFAIEIAAKRVAAPPRGPLG